MAQPSLAELTAVVAGNDGPGFPPATVPNFGGVDALGLRQINFDLMDQVLPGLNNVARHIRPFVAVAWPGVVPYTDAVLGVIQEKAHRLGGETLSAFEVSRKEVAEV